MIPRLSSSFRNVLHRPPDRHRPGGVFSGNHGGWGLWHHPGLDEAAGQLRGTVTSVTFKGVHYDTIVDFYGFKWLIQTTDFCPADSRIGIKIDPDGIHVMKKSQYSGMFGDYSSYSEEYEELDVVEDESGDGEESGSREGGHEE